MMNVYYGALWDSRNGGKPQFVIERGLSIFRTTDIKNALYFLAGGWDIKAVCRDGVMEYQWLLNLTSDKFVKTYPACLRIADLLGFLPDESGYITIKVYEFFNYVYAGKRERLLMSVEKRKTMYSEPERILVTPELEKHNPEPYKIGQEKAEKILDILLLSGIKQDKDSLIRLLQKGETLDLII